MTKTKESVKKSILEVLGDAHHFHCALQRVKNVRKNCSVNDLKLFKESLKTFVAVRLEEVNGKFSDKGRQYVEKVLVMNQLPVATTVFLYGKSTTASVDGMNAANLSIRSLGMFRAFLDFVREYSRRNFQFYEMAGAYSINAILQNVRTKLSIATPIPCPGT